MCSRRRLEKDVSGLGAHSTDRERSSKLEKGNSLHRRIDGFLALQRLYSPKASALRAESEERDSSALAPWAIPLLLPSDTKDTLKCYDLRLTRYEFQYRVAQAETSLRSIRNLLLYKAHMLNSKKMYSSGTVAMTRSNVLIQDIANSIAFEVARYRNVYERLGRLWERVQTGSMRKLKSEAQWHRVLHPLLDCDLVPPTSLDGGGLGEGDKVLTWIWTVGGTGQDLNEVANDGEFPEHSHESNDRL